MSTSDTPAMFVVLPATMPRERIIERIARTLGGLCTERAWAVMVKEHKPKRSNQQNRYLWGVVYPEIMKHLKGWDAQDVHDYLLGEHFGWETIEGFGRRRLRPLRRSSGLTKREFAAYLEFIQRRMAELGIFIPDPDAELAL
jgi:hypothetical protein